MRALRVEVAATLAYWTVVNDDYEVVPAADAFLRHLRFGAGRAEGTTKAYARDLALFLSWCERTGRDLTEGIRALGPFVTMLNTTPVESVGAGQCTSRVLRTSCTTSASGRTITIHPREDILQSHKAAQRSPECQDAYTGTRPKVERKVAHFVRRAWGGRRARVRGQVRIGTDADTRAAAVNWSRLATLKVSFAGGAWSTAPI